MQSALRVLCCLCAVAWLTGCGGSSSSVSGKITVDGKPFMTPEAKGSVSFFSSDGAMSPGTIDSSGNYKLQIGQGSSTKPGQYTVVVVASEIAKPDPAQPSVVPQPKRLTPERYADRTTTDLTADVKQGSNTFNFDLKSTP